MICPEAQYSKPTDRDARSVQKIPGLLASAESRRLLRSARDTARADIAAGAVSPMPKYEPATITTQIAEAPRLLNEWVHDPSEWEVICSVDGQLGACPRNIHGLHRPGKGEG